jgi:hypothetical protein
MGPLGMPRAGPGVAAHAVGTLAGGDAEAAAAPPMNSRDLREKTRLSLMGFDPDPVCSPFDPLI